MKSYVRIYGPPLLKAIRALEKIAVNMPEVCITNTMIEFSMPQFNTELGVMNYFSTIGGIPEQRCGNIISKSGVKMGDFDFVFEWFKDPKMEQVNMLIGQIDEALAPLGVKYTITTK
jgi:hypothetical protein